MILGNRTRIHEFILLGFGDLHELEILLFPIFLVIYTVTITGNVVICALIIFDHHLHTPMYFFLGNLSFLEACYTSNIFPKMLSAVLTGNRVISFSSCFTQWYFCSCLLSIECFLLCLMSYDRYLAVCKPLHYTTIMNVQTCIQLAIASWINGFAVFMVLLIFLLQLPFCGPNEMDHYYCDYFPLLRLSCSDTRWIKILSYAMAAIFTLPPFLLTLTSYVYIIAAILRIPSATGRQKTFSTCSSHLIVVSVFYGSLMIVYMLPRSEGKRDFEKYSSLLYIVVPPLINPFIYSLRNKEVKEALRNVQRIVLYRVNSTKLVNVIHME